MAFFRVLRLIQEEGASSEVRVWWSGGEVAATRCRVEVSDSEKVVSIFKFE
jgi:hypothetical protein